jgi:glycosyltransferase involved in cell wall biosynthesis
VVASDVSGSNEIIVEGKTGHLVPAADASPYAQRLTALLADPDGVARMGREARAMAARDYSPHRNLAAHLGLYGMGLDDVGADAVHALP